jgi:hypothetical protein
MKKKLPLIIAFVVAITAIVCTVVFLVTKLSEDDNETETAEKDNVTNLVDADGDKEPDVDKEPEKNTDKNVDNETETESQNNQDVKYEDYNGTEVIVVSSENVEESKNNKSTADVQAELKDRGFESLLISATYNINGDFDFEYSQNNDIEALHPTYDMVYNNPDNGDQWFIYCYGGQFFAFPITYNQNSGKDVYIVVSEKNSIMSYDCETNTYNEIIPKETDLIIRKVDRIDKKTLDSMTLEVLNENE